MLQANRIAARPMIEATDRSISPPMITNVIASATIAFSMLSWSRLTWFCGFR
jgi:hypothetical protein